MKISLEKHIQKTKKNVSKKPQKIRLKNIFLGGFLRSGGKGAPRVVPRALPGTPQAQIYAKKMPKWRPNVMKKLCVSRFN